MSDTNNIPARVAVIEQFTTDLRAEMRQGFADVRTALTAIEATLTNLREDLGYLRGRVESVPTIWQVAGLCWSILVGAPVLVGAATLVLHRAGLF